MGFLIAIEFSIESYCQWNAANVARESKIAIQTARKDQLQCAHRRRRHGVCQCQRLRRTTRKIECDALARTHTAHRLVSLCASLFSLSLARSSCLRPHRNGLTNHIGVDLGRSHFTIDSSTSKTKCRQTKRLAVGFHRLTVQQQNYSACIRNNPVPRLRLDIIRTRTQTELKRCVTDAHIHRFE